MNGAIYCRVDKKEQITDSDSKVNILIENKDPIILNELNNRLISRGDYIRIIEFLDQKG